MRRLFLALSAISLLACGDSTGAGSSAVGTWRLATINDSGLPFTIDEATNPPYRLEIMSDVLRLFDDGSYTDEYTERENDDGTITTTTYNDDGTWSQTGSNLTVTSQDGTAIYPTISGNTLRLNAPGIVAVYNRQ